MDSDGGVQPWVRRHPSRPRSPSEVEVVIGAPVGVQAPSAPEKGIQMHPAKHVWAFILADVDPKMALLLAHVDPKMADVGPGRSQDGLHVGLKMAVLLAHVDPKIASCWPMSTHEIV